MPGAGSYFLCRRGEVTALLQQAERERDLLLAEFSAFYGGVFGVRVYSVQHVEGCSIAGDLTVNGKACRSYDPVDLCFLDLNMLMLKRMLDAGLSPAVGGGETDVKG